MITQIKKNIPSIRYNLDTAIIEIRIGTNQKKIFKIIFIKRM